MWMLIEWKTEKPVTTYGVVRLSSVIGEKMDDIQEGKTVFVVTKNDYSAMRARVLMISDDKRRLKKEKEILEKRERELKTIVSTCMQSIRKMDFQRPLSSAGDLKAGPSGLKYASKIKIETSTSSSESSSSTDQNQLRDILLANRELVYEYSGDRSVRERREKRKRHRRRPYMPTISHPRTCSTPLHISTLPQISPVPHLISPLTPPPVMQPVTQPVLSTAPTRPLCVDQSTQTEVPYPRSFEKEINQIETLVDELMERQRTLVPRFYDAVIKGTILEPMFKDMCDEEGNLLSERLDNWQEEYDEEYHTCEFCEESGDNEVIHENEEDEHNEEEDGENFTNGANDHNGDSDEHEVNGDNDHNEDSGEHEVNGDHNANGEDDDNRMHCTNGNSSENITDNSYKSSESSRKLDSHFSFNNSSDDMVPIGDGNAEVPTRLLRDMNWAAYSVATRQLLHAIFPRKVLATHSLTGRPSPAFSDKPAKQRLNQDIVNDIVKTVTQNCERVTSSMVRSVITITCTDEAKLYRKRQKLREQKELQRRSKETTSISISEQTLSSDKSNKNENNSDSSKENVSPRSVQLISSDNTVANTSARTSRPKIGQWVLDTSSE